MQCFFITGDGPRLVLELGEDQAQRPSLLQGQKASEVTRYYQVEDPDKNRDICPNVISISPNPGDVIVVDGKFATIALSGRTNDLHLILHVREGQNFWVQDGKGLTIDIIERVITQATLVLNGAAVHDHNCPSGTKLRVI